MNPFVYLNLSLEIWLIQNCVMTLYSIFFVIKSKKGKNESVPKIPQISEKNSLQHNIAGIYFFKLTPLLVFF